MTHRDKKTVDLYREHSCSTSGGCESHIAIKHRVAALSHAYQPTELSIITTNIILDIV